MPELGRWGILSLGGSYYLYVPRQSPIQVSVGRKKITYLLISCFRTSPRRRSHLPRKLGSLPPRARLIPRFEPGDPELLSARHPEESSFLRPRVPGKSTWNLFGLAAQEILTVGYIIRCPNFELPIKPNPISPTKRISKCLNLSYIHVKHFRGKNWLSRISTLE